MNLWWLNDDYSICRLAPGDEWPSWCGGEFISVCRTPDELSIVTASDRVPKSVVQNSGWRAFRIAGQLDFSTIGVIAKISSILAAEGIPMLVISTFNTDYVLVKSTDTSKTAQCLIPAGYQFVSRITSTEFA